MRNCRQPAFQSGSTTDRGTAAIKCLQELIDTKSIVGVTTNPSIFQAALSRGTAYDAQVAELAERGADVDATIRTVTTDDVREACDIASPAMGSRPTASTDGYVDRRSTAPGARHRQHHPAGHRTVEDRRPPNLLIMIPATSISAIASHPGPKVLGQRDAHLLRRTASRL